MRVGGVLIEYGEGTDAEFVVVPAQELFEPLSADASREHGPLRVGLQGRGRNHVGPDPAA